MIICSNVPLFEKYNSKTPCQYLTILTIVNYIYCSFDYTYHEI